CARETGDLGWGTFDFW
nr:immunoglobulin heavy chain junction region [Macaca mulatta]MOV46237.1 immunoglobulin heavy chain junction region [Macaca mulatta]